MISLLGWLEHFNASGLKVVTEDGEDMHEDFILTNAHGCGFTNKEVWGCAEVEECLSHYDAQFHYYNDEEVKE